MRKVCGFKEEMNSFWICSHHQDIHAKIFSWVWIRVEMITSSDFDYRLVLSLILITDFFMTWRWCTQKYVWKFCAMWRKISSHMSTVRFQETEKINQRSTSSEHYLNWDFYHFYFVHQFLSFSNSDYVFSSLARIPGICGKH